MLQFADSSVEAAEAMIKDYFKKGQEDAYKEDGFLEVDEDRENVSMSNFICVVNLDNMQITEESVKRDLDFFESSKVAQDAGFYEQASIMMKNWGAQASE